MERVLSIFMVKIKATEAFLFLQKRKAEMRDKFVPGG